MAELVPANDISAQVKAFIASTLKPAQSRLAFRKEDDIRKYIPLDAVSAMAIVTKKRDPGEYDTKIDVIIGNPMSSHVKKEMYIDDKTIRIPVRSPEKPKVGTKTYERLPDGYKTGEWGTPQFAEWTTLSMFQALMNMGVKKVPEGVTAGSVVKLNGITAKGSWPSIDDQGTTHPPGIWLNVAIVEPAKTTTVVDMYEMPFIFNLPTSRIEPCKEADGTVDPSLIKKYDSERTYVFDVQPDYEEEKTEARTLKDKCIVRATYPNDSKMYADESQKSGMYPVAKLRLSVYQWETPEDFLREKRSALVDITMYEDAFSSLEIGKVDNWCKYAPVIFPHLSYKIFGSLSPQRTATDFSHINGEDAHDAEFAFALSVTGSLMYADVRGVYKKLGIPVSPEWVRKSLALDSAFPPVDSYFKPTGVFNLTECVAVAPQILARPEKCEYRVVTPKDLSEYITNKIAALTVEQGTQLVDWLYGVTRDPPEGLGDAFGFMKTSTPEFQLFAMFESDASQTEQDPAMKKFFEGTGNLTFDLLEAPPVRPAIEGPPPLIADASPLSLPLPLSLPPPLPPTTDARPPAVSDASMLAAAAAAEKNPTGQKRKSDADHSQGKARKGRKA